MNKQTTYREGTITISRLQGGDPHERIQITISGERYRILAEVRMDLADFASALTGLGHCSCRVWVPSAATATETEES